MQILTWALEAMQIGFEGYANSFKGYANRV